MKHKLIIPVVAISMLFVVVSGVNLILKKQDNTYKVKVFKVAEGYGYLILADSKIIIKQSFIPAINGEIPFSNPEDAKVIGNLVKDKLKKNILPAITEAELKEFNVEY
ncbi:DUF4907 domain-containing protein [Abyssalbus ytuae]|uniref:DUF4907 domain-containing protein n=1 Tax=Abyssalbus ytuae TaxID=2926907 RepID=A0A9E7D4C7_9FLAO|nr:DUF4907 domain-containing protein [Abyssalbus ytuae]UOB18774.1 DUF4907 domain-containing protein [Abyssalbus ytuae]